MLYCILPVLIPHDFLPLHAFLLSLCLFFPIVSLIPVLLFLLPVVSWLVYSSPERQSPSACLLKRDLGTRLCVGAVSFGNCNNGKQQQITSPSLSFLQHQNLSIAKPCLPDREAGNKQSERGCFSNLFSPYFRLHEQSFQSFHVPSPVSARIIYRQES